MLDSSVFFCKQKTAYEVRSSDWSSDVCSSDLSLRRKRRESASVHTARSEDGIQPRRDRWLTTDYRQAFLRADPPVDRAKARRCPPTHPRVEESGEGPRTEGSAVRPSSGGRVLPNRSEEAREGKEGGGKGKIRW